MRHSTNSPADGNTHVHEDAHAQLHDTARTDIVSSQCMSGACICDEYGFCACPNSRIGFVNYTTSRFVDIFEQSTRSIQDDPHKEMFTKNDVVQTLENFQKYCVEDLNSLVNYCPAERQRSVCIP